MEVKALEERLKKNEIDQVYLLYGEEKLLLNQTVNQIKALVLPEGLEDFNFDLLLGEKLSPKSVVDVANTLPFMAERRLVLVDNPSFLVNAKDSSKNEEESLLSYLDDPNPQCCLILKCTDKIDKRKKLFKKLQQKAIVVEFAPLKGVQLEKWITAFLKNRGKTIEKPALHYLSAMNSYTLEILSNELEKIVDYAADADIISLEMVQTILSKTVEANIFDLIDAIASKKGKSALNLLENTLYLGEAPLKILALLVRHFRLLIIMKDLKNKSYSEAEIKEKLKLHPFVVTKGLKQGAGFNTKQLIDFLEKLLLCEVELKSSATDPNRLLERLIIDLCYIK